MTFPKVGRTWPNVAPIRAWVRPKFEPLKTLDYNPARLSKSVETDRNSKTAIKIEGGYETKKKKNFLEFEFFADFVR